MMSRALLDSAASLATTSASSATAEPCGSSPKWVWQRELEAMCSRVSRVRAEEANELRRSAEEAERGAMRRIEEVERRVLRCQADEGEALQRFLAGWNSALDLRLDRQGEQVAALARRVGEEMEFARADAAQCREEAHRACDDVLETCRAQLEAFGRQAAAQAAAQAASEGALRAAQDQVKAVQEEAAIGGKAAAALQARVEALEAGGESSAQKLAGVAVQVSELEAGVMDQVQRQQQAQASSLCEELAAQQASLQREAAAERASLRQEAAALSASLQEFRDGLEQRWRENDARHEAMSAECNATRQEATAGSVALAQIEARLRAADESASRLGLELRGVAEAAQQAAVKAEREMSVALARLEERCTAIAQEEARRLEEWCDARCSETARLSEALVTQLAAEAVADNDGRLSLHSARIREATEASAAGIAEAKARIRETADQLRQARQGPQRHDWCIARCMQRLQYLSLTSEAGLWLDSEEFSLGSLGPLLLRLYPRGLRGGDGQCAVALRAAPQGGAALAALAGGVELALGPRRERAELRRERDGQEAVWLCEGLGALEDQVGGPQAVDLCISVQVTGALADAIAAARTPRSPASLADATAAARSPRAPGSPASYGAQGRQAASAGYPGSPSLASPARHAGGAGGVHAFQAGAPAASPAGGSPLHGTAVGTNPFEARPLSSAASSVSFGPPGAGDEAGWDLRRPRVHVPLPGEANPV